MTIDFWVIRHTWFTIQLDHITYDPLLPQWGLANLLWNREQPLLVDLYCGNTKFPTSCINELVVCAKVVLFYHLLRLSCWLTFIWPLIPLHSRVRCTCPQIVLNLYNLQVFLHFWNSRYCPWDVHLLRTLSLHPGLGNQDCSKYYVKSIIFELWILW